MSSSESIECLAAVLRKPGEEVKIEKIVVKSPEKNEIRVRVIAAGVCATDAHFVWGWTTELDVDFQGRPVVLGHEGAGVVESVGEGVSRVGVGDKVMLLWLPECGKCRLCRNPLTNLCESGNFFTTMTFDGKSRMRIKDGDELLSFAGTACFAEYTVVRETQVAKLDSNADLKVAAIIGCAVGTGFGSATQIAKVHSGSVCAVWGLGPIGLSCVLGCRDSGAEVIVGIDTNPDKEWIAREMGVTHFLCPKKETNLESVLMEMRIDYAFDCIGSQSVLDVANRVLQPFGRLIVVGLAKKGAKVTQSVAQLLNGRCISGGYFGNYKPIAGNQELVRKQISGEMDVSKLISSRIPLKDIQKAFDLMKNGKSIRTVIEFE